MLSTCCTNVKRRRPTDDVHTDPLIPTITYNTHQSFRQLLELSNKIIVGKIDSSPGRQHSSQTQYPSDWDRNPSPGRARIFPILCRFFLHMEALIQNPNCNMLYLLIFIMWSAYCFNTVGGGGMILTRREILEELGRMGFTRLSQLKAACRDFERFWKRHDRHRLRFHQ